MKKKKDPFKILATSVQKDIALDKLNLRLNQKKKKIINNYSNSIPVKIIKKVSKLEETDKNILRESEANKNRINFCELLSLQGFDYNTILKTDDIPGVHRNSVPLSSLAENEMIDYGYPELLRDFYTKQDRLYNKKLEDRKRFLGTFQINPSYSAFDNATWEQFLKQFDPLLEPLKNNKDTAEKYNKFIATAKNTLGLSVSNYTVRQDHSDKFKENLHDVVFTSVSEGIKKFYPRGLIIDTFVNKEFRRFRMLKILRKKNKQKVRNDKKKK